VKQRDFDVIVWGASGFTGALVVEYLISTYGVDGDLKWAIAGRNKAKLEQVRGKYLTDNQQASLTIFIADSQDEKSLAELVGKTRVLCTTVGPYALYGTPVVAACVAAGTHYCDLTGEVQWMAKTIAAYQQAAQASGARIVHTCGFDSIPFDLGVWYVQNAMQEKHGVVASHVKGRVGHMSATASGGTIASILTMMETAKKDPSIRRIMSDPYSLNPEGAAKGPDTPDQIGAFFDPDFGQWTAPFIMAAVNTRVVRRSNALLGFPWGENFCYEESILCKSRYSAVRNALGTGLGMAALALGPTRKLAARLLPKPGEGPSREAREAGSYQLFFHASHPDDSCKDIRAKVCGDMDPGYGSTSKMIAEAAVCLAWNEIEVAGGFWTPAAAMNEKLIDRLRSNAGLTFELTPTS